MTPATQQLKVKIEQLMKEHNALEITSALAEVASERALDDGNKGDYERSQNWRRTQHVLEGCAVTLTRFETASETDRQSGRAAGHSAGARG